MPETHKTPFKMEGVYADDPNPIHFIEPDADIYLQPGDDLTPPIYIDDAMHFIQHGASDDSVEQFDDGFDVRVGVEDDSQRLYDMFDTQSAPVMPSVSKRTCGDASDAPKRPRVEQQASENPFGMFRAPERPRAKQQAPVQTQTPETGRLTRRGLPMRGSAMLVAARVASIVSWENATEESSLVRNVANIIDNEISREVSRKRSRPVTQPSARNVQPQPPQSQRDPITFDDSECDDGADGDSEMEQFSEPDEDDLDADFVVQEDAGDEEICSSSDEEDEDDVDEGEDEVESDPEEESESEEEDVESDPEEIVDKRDEPEEDCVEIDPEEIVDKRDEPEEDYVQIEPKEDYVQIEPKEDYGQIEPKEDYVQIETEENAWFLSSFCSDEPEEIVDKRDEPEENAANASAGEGMDEEMTAPVDEQVTGEPS